MNWYELSNWAKDGSACRHNMAYWVGANWWGLGPGAHSHIDGKRWWNVKHPTNYRSLMLSNELPIDGSEILSDSEKESERVMLQIRLPDGIARASISPEQNAIAHSYVGDGSLSQEAWDSGRIALTQKGRLVADRIVREILL